jgi:heterodisulfide reductase subunit B
LSRPLYLFSGCLIPTRLPFLEASSRFVLDRLATNYSDMPDATCCVEPIGLRTMAQDTWLATAARMLATAQEGGRDVLTLCNGCFMSLKEAAHALEDARVRQRANEVLATIGKRYDGGVEVHHITGLLLEHDEELKRAVVRPMPQLTLAAHPGCHMVRPSQVLRADTSFRPEVLGKIASWTGARVVANEEWPRCCGGGLAGIDENLSTRMLTDASGGFRSSGARAILTPCPFCFVQFDLKQKDGLPVLYLAELIALAMGAAPEKIGLQYHRNKLTVLSL